MSSIVETSHFKVLPPKTKQSIKSLSVRKRLILGFSIISAIMLFAVIIMLIRISLAKNFAQEVIEVELPTLQAYLTLNTQFFQLQAARNGWILTHSDLFKNNYMTSLAALHQTELLINQFSKNWTNPENIQNWQELKNSLDKLDAINKNLFTLSTSEGAINILQKEIYPLMNHIITILNGSSTSTTLKDTGLVDHQYQKLHLGNQAIVNDMNLVKITAYALLILVVGSCLLIGFYTTRSIERYINIFRRHSSQIAAGDLTQRLSIENQDELGRLGEDLNSMTESLASTTKQITECCQNMVVTLEEVKQAVDVQSTGASEQASSINEITASVEEIEKSSNQTIDKAKSLGEIAGRTQERGQQGLDAVEQSTLGMKDVRDKVQTIAETILELSNQTQQVGEITAVVNTLSQQSKMLALNASIEAAKAGDAGKGFAVVASEVKNLAEQSEQSTAQVQKILEDIRHATEKAVMATEEGIKGVDKGVHLVEQTGEVVRNLSDVIHETTMASQQIEAAIRQEGIGIEQITAGMNEINQVTSSFVSSVKQTTEAMGQLSQIVGQLRQYMDIYKL